MNNPKVSVIIPVFNGADYLGEAIQSVLDQTYRHFELIIVDDASTNPIYGIVDQFKDPCLKYIRHEENRGAVAARHTGMRASSGDIIAFLDQDDLYHKEKLQIHVAFLNEHPEFGITFNGRFEVQDTPQMMCGLWQPPRTISLQDLILGFPFSPSDTVIKREWALRDEVWEESLPAQDGRVIFNGQEYVFNGRLALSGCNFANVGHALNYRRFHSGRVLSNLSTRCQSELASQEMIFSDPRCPQQVVALRNTALSNTYLDFGTRAMAQDEITLGQEFIGKAAQLNPTIVGGDPCHLTNYLACYSASEGNQNPEVLLGRIFLHLPMTLRQLSSQYDWALGHAYLVKGTRAVIWNRFEEGASNFAQAKNLGVDLDTPYLQILTSMLLDYEIEFGAEAVQNVIRNLTPHLEQMGKHNNVRSVIGSYSLNRAFRSYHVGEFATVPRDVATALTNNPRYLANQGVWAILVRSIAWRVGLYR